MADKQTGDIPPTALTEETLSWFVTHQSDLSLDVGGSDRDIDELGYPERHRYSGPEGAGLPSPQQAYDGYLTDQLPSGQGQPAQTSLRNQTKSMF
jgi:hypothetical protein